MTKYLSNRQQNLKIGIVSYTENETVLEVTGNVGIKTNDTQDYELYVNGDTNIIGDVNVGGASTFVGVGTFSGDLYVGGDLYVSDDIVFDELTARNINLTGIGTIPILDTTTGTIDFLSGTNVSYSGIGTIETLDTTTGTIDFLSNTNLTSGIGTIETLDTTTGTIDFLTNTNLNTSGIGTINNVKIASGIVTAVSGIVTYFGNQIIGTPSGGFKSGAFTINNIDFTKDSINELNFILGKLVPKPPTTLNGVLVTLSGTTTATLCSGFAPTENTGGNLTPTAGVQYSRNTDNTITTNYLTEYGPGDSGTVTAYVNSVGVGTTTLSVGNNNGLYGFLQIANNKDASLSSRNPGITSQFYEVYDSRIIDAPSPDGFNRAYIQQNSFATQNVFWYEDPSTVGSPVLSITSTNVPDSPVLSYSSGVPHYTESVSNTFSHVVSCLNATGDMYTTNIFMTSGGQTTGFQNGGNKSYTNFNGGVNPPVRNYGVGIGVTCIVSQTPRNVHGTVSTDNTKFSLYTATTPYGSGTVRPTISEIVNIMGSTSITNKIDEDNILITTLGTGSGNAVRTNSGSSADNPVPIYTSWSASTTAATYEAIVRGGVLRHDQTNYSTGYLPVGPDYSSGRSGSQYFQIQLIRSNVSQFRINITGSYSGCWVSMPDNSTWTTSLSGTNGWANMFQSYRGSGVPTTIEPGCASGGTMTGTSGIFSCVFGTESSSNDSNNRILLRFKLDSGQSITALSILNT